MSTPPLLFSFTPQAELVADWLISERRTRFTLPEVYEALPTLPQPSVRRAIAQSKFFKRITRGEYELVIPEPEPFETGYRKVRHAKHMYDTHSINPKRQFTNQYGVQAFDMELICEGLAPADVTPAEVDDLVNPKLVDACMEILWFNWQILIDKENIEWRVKGTELLDDYYDDYNPIYEAQAHFTNTQGKYYEEETTFEVREDEW